MKIEESKTVESVVRVQCPCCEVKTKHTIERALDWSDSNDEVSAWGSYQIIRCNGCDKLSFRTVQYFSDEYVPMPDGSMVYCEEEHLYPPRADHSLMDQLYLRDDIYDIPVVVQAIYRETLTAVQHDLPTLAGVGIRAILEATCRELKASTGTLEKKINKLDQLSLLTSAGAEILHGIRLLGNDAAHQMKPPTKKQITAALKVIDHLLLGVYVLPHEASVLPKPKTKATKKATVKK